MGNDGGSIPRRGELVKTKKKPEKVEKDYELQARWRHCTITQQHLQLPMVGCELGKLYNKDAIIEYLLDKESSDNCPHIRGLKDVKELKLAINPAYSENDSKRWVADSYYDHQDSEFICPVVGFCFLWNCGCVLSERALKEIPIKKCPSCNKEYDDNDIIVINGDKNDVEKLHGKMKERRLAAKKEKLKKRKIQEVDPTSLYKPITKTPSNSDKITPKVRKINSNVNDAVIYGAASATKDIMDKNDLKPKSKTFKSIFTKSGPTKSKRDTAHWVTYDPYNL
ncbi:uncharacterized protein TRIADDRAFT_58086 [Trichoplax adhaerens]|uniref:Replication termination factor 2 n=1 Tax=Trichoplax adhaerens TaxID=10228 RepID=B3S2N1_TRIAD|nr:hypothetical protein TRIADDRAFT_58086 [Trichoplax adhaerens]EDV23447.1 hypothetical protein TRIADDRAFT_58086 [Trichoplax adhaerens]|eukprot:XP_002114357.1 hypothetical protein TRIADDRAFT_58086 [Trichoplax adhaerens]